MTRWLLGSSTPLRIGLQWLLGAALLIGVQLLLARAYDSPPRMVNAMLYGTLSLSPIVIGAVSFAIAGRSRGLWLNAGRSRLQLHAWCERLMLRVALAIALPLALLGGVAVDFPVAATGVAWNLPAGGDDGPGSWRRVVRLHAAAPAHFPRRHRRAAAGHRLVLRTGAAVVRRVCAAALGQWSPHNSRWRRYCAKWLMCAGARPTGRATSTSRRS